jgi:hypothetical protein
MPRVTSAASSANDAEPERPGSAADHGGDMPC